MEVAVIIMLVAFVIGLAMMGIQAEDRNKALRESEADYRGSLTSLKAAPMDADLKEETLRKGRVYSNLTRNKQGVTMYDEVALMNDINAACAGAGIPQIRAEQPSKSVEDRFRNLQRLKEGGLITEEEYNQRRSEIIQEL